MGLGECIVACLGILSITFLLICYIYKDMVYEDDKKGNDK